MQLGALLGCVGYGKQTSEDAAYVGRVDVAAQFSRCGAGLEHHCQDLRGRRAGGHEEPVVLAWLMRREIDPIVGVGRVEQIEEALAARRVRLSDEHLARFAEAR